MSVIWVLLFFSRDLRSLNCRQCRWGSDCGNSLSTFDFLGLSLRWSQNIAETIQGGKTGCCLGIPSTEDREIWTWPSVTNRCSNRYMKTYIANIIFRTQRIPKLIFVGFDFQICVGLLGMWYLSTLLADCGSNPRSRTQDIYYKGQSYPLLFRKCSCFTSWETNG